MTAQNRRAAHSAALALLAAGGCGTLLTPPAPLASAPPDADVPQDTTRLLRSLVVAADVDPGGYDRERFNYPQGGTDTAGCSTRSRVLIQDSTIEPAQVASPGCKVLAGRWIDPYTGVTYTSPAEVSIDHVVPLKEAWRSGAAAWPTERLVAFANDVTLRDALAAVEGSGNEEKGDKDPARWRPPDRARWGTYATGWVTVKASWGLTIDIAEKAALEAMLASSPTSPTTSQADGAVPPPPPTDSVAAPATTTSSPSSTSVYYPSCAAARAAGAAPLRRGGPGYTDALDADRNGVACS